MFVEAANRANITVKILDQQHAPATQIVTPQNHIIGSFQDSEKVAELAKQCDILTVEIEHVNTKALELVSQSTEIQIHPSWQTLRTVQDKYAQKQHLAANNIALVPFEEIRTSSLEQLEQVGEKLGWPFMLKSKTQAYDGRGNFKVRSKADCAAALQVLHDRPLYAEKWAPFQKELAVIVVKTRGETFSYPTVETVHEDSVCKVVYAPAICVSQKLNEAAQKLARDAIATFSGKGVYGVEMFLVNDQILINEIAPRPHNSGHYTIEGCRVSQYDAHLRALLDEPIYPEDLTLREPAVMLNILGGAGPDSHLILASKARATRAASLHLYGKGEARPGRKMGHITVTAPYMYKAEKIIEPLVAASNEVRASRTDLRPLEPKEQTSPRPRSSKPVLVTTGSKSDQPKLQACYDILHALEIPYEARITSAHRTPDHMSRVAKEAESRGVKVIIGAAGGAAHLPGMLAANTTIPVIGVPIILRGDGIDSVLSILNMPSGVPVATVAADKSANAALLAARILARFDPDLNTRLDRYVKDAERKSLESDLELQRQHS